MNRDREFAMQRGVLGVFALVAAAATADAATVTVSCHLSNAYFDGGTITGNQSNDIGCRGRYSVAPNLTIHRLPCGSRTDG